MVRPQIYELYTVRKLDGARLFAFYRGKLLKKEPQLPAETVEKLRQIRGRLDILIAKDSARL
jgi:hypothetical protein